MNDPMGDCPVHSPKEEQHIVEDLWNHPTVYIQFARIQHQIVGMAVCFQNYSTFKGAPFMNILDLIVSPEFRGQGVGKALIHGVVLKALEHNCVKVTLEVRDDNQNAQELFKRFGFHSCEPPIEYLSKSLPKHAGILPKPCYLYKVSKM